MKQVLRYLRIAKPFLQFAGEELAALDENETGQDDKAAAAIRYIVTVVEALTRNQPVPDAPAELK